MDQDGVADAAKRLGARGLLGKAACAARARLPWLLCRRTVRGVAAYFDLITEDGQLFFGDSFHFGFFPGGWQSLPQALDAHTDLVLRAGRDPAGDGSFARQLSLGEGVDSENLTAGYAGGVLYVTIPASPKTRARRVKVTRAAGGSRIVPGSTVEPGKAPAGSTGGGAG